MVHLTSIFLILLGSHYAWRLLRFANGFHRVRRTPVPASSGALPFVSVIVPARNEEATIGPCVTSILANTYPADRFEVIVADDLSHDETASIVRLLQARYNLEPALAAAGPLQKPGEELRLHLLTVAENAIHDRAHKKRALEKAISTARGDVILTTDADCTVPPDWIHRMVRHLDADTGFVSGPVLYHPGRTPFRHLQALEFLGLVTLGAGAIGLGRPILCNGANVAYRRQAFVDADGYRGLDHLTSGDDELLMQKIADRTAWRVRFCSAPAAAVFTDPAPSLAAFFAQRRRWASKGALYPRPGLVLMNILFFAFFLLLAASLLAAPFYPTLWGPLAVAVGLKLFAEAAVLLPAARHYGRTWLFAYFLPAQLLHLPYLLTAATAGLLGQYQWKGRTIDR